MKSRKGQLVCQQLKNIYRKTLKKWGVVPTFTKSAGETLGSRLLDHIIFTHNEYYSFLEDGLL